MFSEEVKTKDGVTKNVVAGSKEELAEGVKAAKAETTPTYPNINHPVKKGHDMVDVQEDGSVELQDGTGAHNSPRDAITDSGKVEGDSEVPAFPEGEPERIKAAPVTAETPQEDITRDGRLSGDKKSSKK